MVYPRHEVDNTSSPYNAMAMLHVFYSDGSEAFGSGTFIDGYHVLTASHVVFAGVHGGVATRIEITPGYDAVPESGEGSSPYGTYLGVEVAYFDDFDPNWDGYIFTGDGVAGTLQGTERDVAVIRTSGLDGAHPYTMRWSTGFQKGQLHSAGYPGNANQNPVELVSPFEKSAIDNFIAGHGLGPGSSGGPNWGLVDGVPTIFAVTSQGNEVTTDAWMATLDAHADWIRWYQQALDYRITGTSKPDIYHVLKAEFIAAQPDGFNLRAIGPNFEENQFPFLAQAVDGKSGIDTIYLPLASGTLKPGDPELISLNASLEGYSIFWERGSDGNVTGRIEGYYSLWFKNIERIEFTDGVIDLTRGAIGTKYYVGDHPDGFVATHYTGPLSSLAAVVENRTGTAAADILIGNAHSESITAGSGADRIEGRSGRDTIVGGYGKDTIKGGGGDDQYVFSTTPGSGNVDLIKDFAHDADRIVLSASIFAAIGSSLTATEFFAKAGAVRAHDASDRIVYDRTTGKLYYDDDGNRSGGHASIHFATLGNKPQLFDLGDLAVV